jgi:glycosyltransferase involved in cell wall biosynthesis
MSNDRIIPITHIITDLNVGGAEIMLLKLLRSVDQEQFPSRVISLTDIGPIGRQMKALFVKVTALGMQPGRMAPADINHLGRVLKEEPVQVVQTWMYHSDLLGGLAARNAGIHGIAWNIRNSTLDLKKSKVSTLITVGACSLLSYFIPRKIAVCSQVAAQVHRKAGYASGKMRIIPNGFDLSAFKPDADAGLRFRRKINLTHETPVVGLAARFDEQKDHRTFIKAAGILLESIPSVHFILCGEGVTNENTLIKSCIEETGQPDHFHLLGRLDEMAAFHNACDVAVSSSAYGESFSNTLGEAMACGVVCVSTNVGGAPEVLGRTGKIVPTRDADALARAIRDLLLLSDEERMDMSKAVRARILQDFDIQKIARDYMDFWTELAGTSD